MNSNNIDSKKIGIGIALATILGVGVVTIAKDTPAQNVLDDTATAYDQTTRSQTRSNPSVAQAATHSTSSMFKDDDRDTNEASEGTSSDDDNPSSQTSGSATSSTSAASTASYKDGTYTTTVSYRSPGGMDKLGVSITLQGGIITDTTASAQPGNETSSEYEGAFVQSYKASVIGRNISTLSVGRIAGASLTSRAFNSALAQVRSQAAL